MGDESPDEELLPADYKPYSQRPEWSDVQPLEQDDGENPVVMIAYSDKFKDVYDYFRGIVAISEKSQRALDLTKDALRLNAANYTVWQYRRDILNTLNLNLSHELQYVDEVIIDNPKNYQVWHHRRVIVEWLNDPSQELELTEYVLQLDAKNYHAWQHRQWVLQHFNLFEDELIFVDKLLSSDVRNNSAWNQRFFVLKNTGFTGDVLEREIKYVINRIRLCKNNESSWNFLRGLLQQGTGYMDQYQEVTDFCEELLTAGVTSPYLYAFLIDLYEEKCSRDYITNVAECKDLSIRVINLCDLMINEYDIIRCKYWEYVKNNLERQFKQLALLAECRENSTETESTTTTEKTDDN